MKILLALISVTSATLFSFSALSSDWSAVMKTNRGIIYIDLKSIAKRSGYIYYKTLNDNSKRTNEGAKSLIMENHADCRSAKLKPTKMKFYEGSMGTGRLLGEVSKGEWISSSILSNTGMGYTLE